MIKEFWRYLTDHWKLGKEESEEDTARRILRDAYAVVRNTDTPHWDALCVRLSKELLDNLEVLHYEMQQGKLSHEMLCARLAPVFSIIVLMRKTKDILREAENQEERLAEIMAAKAEQATRPPAEVSYQ